MTISFAASSPTIGIPLLNIAVGPQLDLHGRYTTSPSNTRVGGILVDGAATELTLSGGTGAFPYRAGNEAWRCDAVRLRMRITRALGRWRWRE